MTQVFLLVIALQIRAGQQSITVNLQPLTTHIYHVMIIVTGGFSEKSFFIIIFRSSCTQMFFKTGVIRNFAIFPGKPYGLQLYFNLVPKETSTQVFPCEYCKKLYKQFFYRTPPIAAFVSLIK